MARIKTAALPCAIALGVACAALGQTARPGSGAQGNGTTATRDSGPAPTVSGGRLLDPTIAKRKLDALLDRWEAQSAKIHTLDARFVRTDESPGWNDKTVFVGRAILKSPDLAFLNFERLESGKLEAFEQTRCTGKEVYHYRTATHQIFIYPMPADRRQRALEEGPLPFLFNMRAADAKARYTMIFEGESLDYYFLRIVPREAIDREAFLRADVALNKKTFMPDIIRLLAPNQKDTQTYDFRGSGAFIRPNAPVNEANFRGDVLDGWKVVRNPAPDSRSREDIGAQVPKRAMPRQAAPGRRR